MVRYFLPFMVLCFGFAGLLSGQGKGVYHSLEEALKHPEDARYLKLAHINELQPSIVALQNLETIYLQEPSGVKLPKYLKQLPNWHNLVLEQPEYILGDLSQFPQLTGLEIIDGRLFLHFAKNKGLKYIERLVFSRSMPGKVPPTPNLQSVRIFESPLEVALPTFLADHHFDMLLISACDWGDEAYDFGGIDSLLVGGCKVLQDPKPNLNLRGIAVVFSEWPGVVNYLLDSRNQVGHVFMEGMEMPLEDVYRMRGRYGKEFEMEVEAEE